jgi:hypothetical protein
MSETTSKKRKLSLPLIVAGGVSSLVLALGMSPTFSAFSASITNSLNTASAGTLWMTETDSSGGVICNSNDAATPLQSLATNAATCATINKYGGKVMVPGGLPQNTTVTIKNSGTITPTSFTLAPQGCTQVLGTPNGGATDACSKFIIKVYKGADTTGPQLILLPSEQTAGTFVTALNLTPLANGSTQQYTFSVQLSNVGNTYQGITISQPLIWTFQT